MDIVQKNPYQYQNKKKEESIKAISSVEFDEIFNTYYKRIYKYICYRIDDLNMAEDLCSQTFERVITKYDTFSPEKASFEVWLFAIARNSVTDFHRNNKKRFHLSLESVLELISPNASLEDKLIMEDNNRELFIALRKLSEKERNVVAMKYAAGLKNSEIAKLLGISSSNVGVVLYRSLKKLHKLLDVGGYENEEA